jgi:NAD(P)-dependent dehydrogenase (short-subunit alcohol dehydrogenase family)
VACDVSRYGDAERVVERVIRHHGRVDVLVNNAGVIEPIGVVEGCDPDSWTHNLMVNLVGVFNCFLEGWSAYCASKAGVAMLTRSIALEVGDAGARVYNLQPGVVATDMQGEICASGINEVSEIAHEGLGNPSEPARVVVWLCTEGAADLSGNELSINNPELRRRAGLGG